MPKCNHEQKWISTATKDDPSGYFLCSNCEIELPCDRGRWYCSICKESTCISCKKNPNPPKLENKCKKCNAEKELIPSFTHRQFKCEICNSTYPKDSGKWTCENVACNYNICLTCAESAQCDEHHILCFTGGDDVECDQCGDQIEDYFHWKCGNCKFDLCSKCIIRLVKKNGFQPVFQDDGSGAKKNKNPVKRVPLKKINEMTKEDPANAFKEIEKQGVFYQDFNKEKIDYLIQELHTALSANMQIKKVMQDFIDAINQVNELNNQEKNQFTEGRKQRENYLFLLFFHLHKYGLFDYCQKFASKLPKSLEALQSKCLFISNIATYQFDLCENYLSIFAGDDNLMSYYYHRSKNYSKLIDKFEKGDKVNINYALNYIEALMAKGLDDEQNKQKIEEFLTSCENNINKYTESNYKFVLYKGLYLYNQAKKLKEKTNNADFNACLNFFINYEKDPKNSVNVEKMKEDPFYYTLLFRCEQELGKNKESLYNLFKAFSLFYAKTKEDDFQIFDLRDTFLRGCMSSEMKRRVELCENYANMKDVYSTVGTVAQTDDFKNGVTNIEKIMNNFTYNKTNNESMEEYLNPDAGLTKTQIKQIEDMNKEREQKMIESYNKEIKGLKEQVEKYKSETDKKFADIQNEIDQMKEWLNVSGIKDKSEVLKKMKELRETKPQIHAYANSFFWTFSDIMIAARSLETGMVEGSGGVDNTLGDSVANVVSKIVDKTSSALQGIPIVGTVLSFVNTVVGTINSEVKDAKKKHRINGLIKVFKQSKEVDINVDRIDTVIGQTALEIVTNTNCAIFPKETPDAIDKMVKVINAYKAVRDFNFGIGQAIVEAKNKHKLNQLCDEQYAEECKLACQDVGLLTSYIVSNCDTILELANKSQKPLYQIFAEAVLLHYTSLNLASNQVDKEGEGEKKKAACCTIY